MPYYEYEVKEKKGKAVRRQAFAQNRQELIKTLQKEGMIILSIKESTPAAERHHKKMHKKVKSEDLMLFAKEFAILLENGVVITDALEVILKQIESSQLVEVLKNLKKDLESGVTLRDAIAKHPKAFGSFWHDMIDAGEVSGQLPFVMRQIESFLKSGEELKKKVINALIYPAVLFTVAVGVIILFVFKIIPVFKDLFSSLGSRLPAFTQMVLDLSTIIRSFFIFIVIGVIILVVLFRKILSTRQGKYAYENILLKMPVAGNLFLSLALEKFSSTLGVLLKSGIPIIRALEVASKTSESVVFSDKLEEVKMKVVAGSSFSEALQQTGLFPPIAVQLVLVAEKTGNYSGMLEEVAKYYGEVVEVAVTRFTALIEPLVLLFMAAVIGSLLVAMFLPIFKIASAGA